MNLNLRDQPNASPVLPHAHALHRYRSHTHTHTHTYTHTYVHTQVDLSSIFEKTALAPVVVSIGHLDTDLQGRAVLVLSASIDLRCVGVWACGRVGVWVCGCVCGGVYDAWVFRERYKAVKGDGRPRDFFPDPRKQVIPPTPPSCAHARAP